MDIYNIVITSKVVELKWFFAMFNDILRYTASNIKSKMDKSLFTPDLLMFNVEKDVLNNTSFFVS